VNSARPGELLASVFGCTDVTTGAPLAVLSIAETSNPDTHIQY
jgi:hypothetical protein